MFGSVVWFWDGCLFLDGKSYQNHGSVKNGCIFNTSYLFQILCRHWTMIMGERAVIFGWLIFGLLLYLAPRNKKDGECCEMLDFKEKWYKSQVNSKRVLVRSFVVPSKNKGRCYKLSFSVQSLASILKHLPCTANSAATWWPKRSKDVLGFVFGFLAETLWALLLAQPCSDFCGIVRGAAWG